jgi:hypothetical protein
VSDVAGADPAASVVQLQAAINAMYSACQAGGTGTAICGLDCASATFWFSDELEVAHERWLM